MGNENSTGEGGTEPVEPTNATPTATVESIATELIGEKPGVSEHAIAAHSARQAANVGKDKAGATFNPAIHAVNADGSPRTTTKGIFALKRGRKGGAAEAPKATNKGVVIPGASVAASSNEQAARAGGAGAANLMLMVSVALGGAEWHPVKDDKTGRDEKLMLETAFGDFFVSQGWQDLPPGWALAAACGMYALPRFAMPQTRTRMQRAKEWLWGKIGSWRARRSAKKRGLPESDVERADREGREARRGDSDRG